MTPVSKSPSSAPPTGEHGESSEQDQTLAQTSTSKRDVVLVHGATEDGQGVRVLRARNAQLELGTVRPLQPGKPIHGEVVSLTPRANAPENVYDVKVELDSTPSPTGASGRTSASRSGPAQVATDLYRNNWDAIYKRKKRGSKPN